MVSSSHDTMPHTLPRSTHSSRPPRRASIAPMAMLNGTATDTSPVIWTGGCMNMPKWTSSGLMPRPSMGTKSRRSSGLARKTMTPRRNAKNTAIRAVA